MKAQTKSLVLSALMIACLGSLCLVFVAAQSTAGDVVLYASEAAVRAGRWTVVSDGSAAGGARMALPDAGAPKLLLPLPNPASYFEMSFYAEAGRAYRLWIRGKAQNDFWGNDSVWVQFSGAVDSSGAPSYRIATTSGAEINLEDCLGGGLSGWGWQDNGWGVGALGPLVYFQATGMQTIRVQSREDGLSIDQIVLSPATYISASPGALKNDTVILPETGAPPPPPPPPPSPPPVTSDIVIWASDIPGARIAGSWSKTYNGSAAGQTVMHHPEAGAPKLPAALASPTSYFEMPFSVNAGTAYRLWIRGKADSNSPYNDSIFFQFSGSVDAAGAAVYRIGTTGAATVNIEDDLGRGLSDWGWQDNGWGAGVMGPLVYFQATGTQTLRVQSREDGLSIDQIVLSAQAYLNSSPGALRNDTVILPSTIGGPPPSNEPPQVSISATPTSGTFPLLASFSSNASDPDGYIASYSWTFGDGQSSSLPFPINTYQSAGTFTARLTVTDNDGATATASRTITVNTPPPPPSSTQLKVLSWNLHFGRGTDSVYNLDRQATHIANINPDLAALCEISRYSGDDSVMILVNLLTQKTSRTWYWHFVPKYPGCPEGNLILSKFPLQATDSHFLIHHRSIAQVRVNVGGRSVNFFATHLDHTAAPIRWVQVVELTIWMSSFAEPRIIGGDFNAGPNTSEIGRMMPFYHDSWMEALNAGVAVGYPDNPVQVQTRTRRGRLDYLFYSRGATNLIVRASQVPDSRDLNNRNVIEYLGTLDDRGVRPSDHNQVVTIFEVR